MMSERSGIQGLGYEEARQWLHDHLPAQDQTVASPVPPSMAALDGFLFAVSQAPVPVSASQWLGDLLPLFEENEPSQTLNSVLSYQRHVEHRCERRHYPIPDTRGLDAIAQIEPGQALNDWSLGFEAGFGHVVDTWNRLIPTDLKTELDSQCFALTFFASPDKARRFLARRDSRMRPEQLADQVLEQFPKAVDLHARLSISIAAVAGSGKETKPGRNDPCPCGSGRKYKHCCLQ